MKILSVTGVTKTADFRIEKAIDSIALITDRPYSGLTNHTIKIEVEKSNGDNITICPNMPLNALISLTSYGNPAIRTMPTLGNKMVAFIELSPILGIHLEGGDAIVISMSGLIATNNYELVGFENPVTSQVVNVFKRNVIKQNEVSKVFGVNQYESVFFQDCENIDEVIFTLDSGHTFRRSLTEMKIESSDVDPIQLLDNTNNTYKIQNQDELIYPLEGVRQIEVKLNNGATDLVMWFMDNVID